MPSPFPGMNPFLEQDDAWRTFHRMFISALSTTLNPQLGGDYFGRLIPLAYTIEKDCDHSGNAGGRDKNWPVPVSVFPLQIEVERISLLEVNHVKTRQKIALITVLDTSSKLSPSGRAQYLHKRNQILKSDVHLVEIDLLRGGPRLPFKDLLACDYYVMVSRAQKRPAADLWPIRLRDRLPVIPIPLRTPDADVSLDLQALLHQVYDAAGYEKYIYDGEPAPPIADADMDWIRPFIPAHEQQNGQAQG